MFLDRVYEHVMLPPILLQVVDTAAFQRLRALKQLGATSFIYPGAVHTRFEHSIGVAHLARVFLESIRRRQPELHITDEDIHKVMLAGLLHDVGHGPFSHLFEDVMKQCGVVFDHEEMSQRVGRRILRPLISQKEEDEVIKIMSGCCSPNLKYAEIVSNKRNGFDVDKLDYFLRDSLCCFGKPAVDVRYNRIFNSARLVCDGNQWKLAFEEKSAFMLRELLTLRAKLHKSVYQHRVVRAVGHMIGDVLRVAAPYFRVGGRTILESAADETLLLRLGDWVLEAIESSTDANLQQARDIIERLRMRDIYRPVFICSLGNDVTPEPDWLQRLSCDILACTSSVARPVVTAEDFIVDVVKICHGQGRSDPLQRVPFFNPKRPLQPIFHMSSQRLCSSLFTPLAFEERSLMIFERRNTNGAIRTACEQLKIDEKYRNVFVDSLPFYNPL